MLLIGGIDSTQGNIIQLFACLSRSIELIAYNNSLKKNFIHKSTYHTLLGNQSTFCTNFLKYDKDVNDNTKKILSLKGTEVHAIYLSRPTQNEKITHKFTSFVKKWLTKKISKLDGIIFFPETRYCDVYSRCTVPNLRILSPLITHVSNIWNSSLEQKVWLIHLRPYSVLKSKSFSGTRKNNVVTNDRAKYEMKLQTLFERPTNNILHTILLRYGDVYGETRRFFRALNLDSSSMPDDLITSLTHAALTNSVMEVTQLQSANARFDFLHIFDLFRYLRASMQALSEASSAALAGGDSQAHVRTHDISCGSAISLDQVLGTVYSATSCRSPIRTISTLNSGKDYVKAFPLLEAIDVTLRELGPIRSPISLGDGIRLLAASLNEHDAAAVASEYNKQCTHFAPDVSQFTNCSVALFARSSFFSENHVGCVYDYIDYAVKTKSWWIANVGQSQTYRATFSGIHVEQLPFYRDWAGVREPYFRLFCLAQDGRRYLSVRTNGNIEVVSERWSWFQFLHHKLSNAHAWVATTAVNVTVLTDVSPRVLADVRFVYSDRTRANSFMIPVFANKPFRISNLDGRAESVELFSIAALSCPPRGNRPFLPYLSRERYSELLWELDSEDFVPDNRDMLPASLLASPQRPYCRRLLQAKRYLSSDLAARQSLVTTLTPRLAADVGRWDWARERPVCDTLCGLVRNCVRTGYCRCVAGLPACGGSAGRQPNLSSGASTKRRRKEAQQASGIFKKQVLPLFQGDSTLPKVHVLAPHPDHPYGNMSTPEFVRIGNGSCLNADYFTMKVLQSVSVPLEEADFVFVQFYHGVLHHSQGVANYWLDQEFNTSAEHAESFRHRMKSTAVFVWMLVHDAGGCLHFSWHHLAMPKNWNRQPPALRSSIVMSAMGDYNTNCYFPHKDVVIAPVTCLTSELIARFEDASGVRPAQDRKTLVFFKGSQWGTGKIARLRVMSQALYPRTSRHDPSALFLGSRTLVDYLSGLDILNDSVFCPHVPGTAGWSFRLVDVIYSGCIPVLVTGFTHYPYQDLLDYEAFSVVVPMKQLNVLEDVLLAVSPAERTRKQRLLMEVRDFLVYRPGRTLEDFLRKKGPVFLGLLNLKLRMVTSFDPSRRPTDP